MNEDVSGFGFGSFLVGWGWVVGGCLFGLDWDGMVFDLFLFFP